ncbi:tetratricopeptide repeat protein [Marinifilum sp. N1E240]|uniref:ATP-binding protein n=1 Tax=Marinifilum sp. N1E240 TaxID=2608082 RepID=UPI00128CA27E|nr:tetratricopeptide repeat protein [Marinifilum sp. N1E240]MPQ46674.1 tetratricopeptide repeat protein [Marinifilum sp. N1E240]
MRKLFLYILISFISFTAVSQNKVDSLKNLLDSSEDKEKAYIYYQLSRELYYKDVLQVRYYSLKADSIATIFDIDSTRVNALNNLTYASLQTGKVNDAIAYNQTAMDIAEQKNLKKEKIKTIFFKGYYLYATGQPDSSLVHLNRAFKLATESKESKIKMQCLNTMAANYLNQGKYDKALSNFTQAYSIADSMQLKKMLPNLSLNIGTTLLYNEDLEQAIGYFERVIEMSDTTDVNLAYASALNNLGACYSRKADHEKALVYFEKALPAYQKLNNQFQIAQLYANLGQSNYILGRIEAARPYLKKAISLNRASKSSNQLIINLIILGKLQLQENEFLQAKYSLFEAQELVNKYNINYNKVDLYKAISLYFENTGQFNEALNYKQKELNFKDSIFNVDHQQQIAELETKFQSKQKEKDNQILRKDLSIEKMKVQEQTTIRNFLIALSILIIILGSILLNRARIKRQAHKIIEKQKLELEIANATKDKFFSIIAHDLRSPFSTIIGFSDFLNEEYDDLSNEERKAQILDIKKASHRTYNLLENLLTWSKVQQGGVKINPEPIQLNALLKRSVNNFQSSAKLKNIDLSFESDQLINVITDQFSFELVIGNLINNAIKFTPAGGSINIKALVKNNKAIVKVKDTGVGLSQTAAQKIFNINESYTTKGTNDEKGSGLGLILCKEFVEMNNGEIWFCNEYDKGACFAFSQPLA